MFSLIIPSLFLVACHFALGSPEACLVHLVLAQVPSLGDPGRHAKPGTRRRVLLGDQDCRQHSARRGRPADHTNALACLACGIQADPSDRVQCSFGRPLRLDIERSRIASRSRPDVVRLLVCPLHGVDRQIGYGDAVIHLLFSHDTIVLQRMTAASSLDVAPAGTRGTIRVASAPARRLLARQRACTEASHRAPTTLRSHQAVLPSSEPRRPDASMCETRETCDRDQRTISCSSKGKRATQQPHASLPDL